MKPSIFKRDFPIHRIFERSCELGLWLLTADKISEVFRPRITKKFHGKLNTTLENIEHGHPHLSRLLQARLRQAKKFATLLRNEICSNNLADFGLRKGLEHLGDVREKFLGITERFTTFQARRLNTHVDFPLLHRLALPITVGTAKYPGIKIQDTRVIRLMQVLLHAGTTVGGWRAQQLHEVILTSFGLSNKRYGLNQLRYDLRKLRAHGLLERDGKRYAYRLTAKGVKSPRCSYSSIIACAVRLPTASSTVVQIPASSLTASSKLLCTRRMTPFKGSSNSWKSHDFAEQPLSKIWSARNSRQVAIACDRWHPPAPTVA